MTSEVDPVRVLQMLKLDPSTEPGLYKWLTDVLTAGAPLPPPWNTKKDSKGRIFFWDTLNKKTQWNHPSDKTVLEPLCSFFRENFKPPMNVEKIISACQVKWF